MDANLAKGLSIVILLVLSVLFGWLPIGLFYKGVLNANGTPRRKMILDFLNCFAGGVFLGTCLLHLLAEGIEEFEEYKEDVQFDNEFPFFETIVALGLFLMSAVEKIGFGIISMRDGNKVKDVEGRHSTHEASHVATQPQTVTEMPPSSATRAATYGVATGNGRETVSGGMEFGGRKAKRGNLELGMIENGSDSPPGVMLLSATNLTYKSPAGCAASDQPQGAGTRSHHDDHHHHTLMEVNACTPTDITKVSAVRALLLLLALSFHTVFDGLAVGLQETAFDVWEVLVAIAIHKSLVTFCLGLELAASSSGKLKQPILFMLLFAFISPIGIAIGMGVTSGHVDHLAEQLVSCILQALATGTFVYVTFFEILVQQFAHHDARSGKVWVDLLKIFLTAVGFACMAVVKLLDKD